MDVNAYQAEAMKLLNPALTEQDVLMNALLGIPLSEILQGNLDKLHRRYPQGFDTRRSQHREAEA